MSEGQGFVNCVAGTALTKRKWHGWVGAADGLLSEAWTFATTPAPRRWFLEYGWVEASE